MSRFVRREGMYRWDAAGAAERWGPRAGHPGTVELIEELLDHGWVKSALDTLLAQPSLGPDETRYLAAQIIDRALELGRTLDRPERERLLELLGAPKHLKTRRNAEKAAAMMEIVAEIAAKPDKLTTLSAIQRDYKVSRPTAAKLNKAARKLRE